MSPFRADLVVSLVAGTCILTLAVVSKYFIRAELDFVSQYGPVWILMVYMMTKGRARRSRVCATPVLWSLTMVLTTAAILFVYSLR